jgi:hypothetical protein
MASIQSSAAKPKTFSDTLNYYSGNLVDWKGTMELVRSGVHQYSYSELAVRGAMFLGGDSLPLMVDLQ